MKTLKIMNTIITMICVLLFTNCSKDNTTNISKEMLIGKWNSYEVIDNNDTIQGPTELLNTYYSGIEIYLNAFSMFLVDETGLIYGRSDSTGTSWEINEENLYLSSITPDLEPIPSSVFIQKLTKEEFWIKFDDSIIKLKRLNNE